ncbi:MAG: EAL domain-containing protein [Rhodospirillaceae bacterium]
MCNLISGGSVTRPRVLIVEDDDQILNGYAAVLSRGPNGVVFGDETARRLSELSFDLFGDKSSYDCEESFDLCLCHQAAEAIQAVVAANREQRPFAVAFIDVRLPPGPDGIALGECIRALDPLTNIVIITGFSDLPPEEIAKRIPPPDKLLYCQKPLHAAELRQFAMAMSAKWNSERELLASKEHVERLLSSTNVVLYSSSGLRNQELTYVSDNVEHVFGYRSEHYLADDKFLEKHIHPDDLPNRQRALDALVDGGVEVAMVYRVLTASGDYRWVRDQLKVVNNGHSKPTELVGCWLDVTERRRDEDRIRYLAYHDSLTGLPNRVSMYSILEKVISRAERYHHKVAVLFLDIDHFKKINDSLGHSAGDQLLREAASRIASVVRSDEVVCRQVGDGTESLTEVLTEGSTVCRLGGDEFVVILSEVANPDGAAAVARRIREAIAAPIQIGNVFDEISITTSIGISLYPDDGHDAETLLKFADNAMYVAKESGRNVISFFAKAQGEKADKRLLLESRLRKSFESGSLTLCYQPKIYISSSGVTGVEALLRWQHADYGEVLPSDFIPIAELSGLIVPIGEWVLTEAVRQAMAWRLSGMPMLGVSVNISAVQFHNPNLISHISSVMAEYGFPFRSLTLELTESVLIGDSDASVRRLNQLGELGVQISIDDFGTGNSSIAYLQRFPVNELKIDKSFVRNIPGNRNDAAIVRATIALGHSLDVRVVAEGVETEPQLDYVREQRCDEAQGNYIAPPLPADAFRRWWHHHSPTKPQSVQKAATLHLVH